MILVTVVVVVVASSLIQLLGMTATFRRVLVACATTIIPTAVSWGGLVTALKLCRRRCRLFGLLLAPEELIIVDRVHTWLRFHFDIESAVIVLLTYTDRIFVSIDGHQGSQRVTKGCVVPIMFDFFDEFIDRVENI